MPKFLRVVETLVGWVWPPLPIWAIYLFYKEDGQAMTVFFIGSILATLEILLKRKRTGSYKFIFNEPHFALMRLIKRR